MKGVKKVLRKWIQSENIPKVVSNAVYPRSLDQFWMLLYEMIQGFFDKQIYIESSAMLHRGKCPSNRTCEGLADLYIYN